ncbi:MAG: O-antigen ligase family protein [Sporolactobacillus sp.]|jgi:teichuronic acid biosynthesis protein TuaE|nr:O-antigen ligase family protein [Sporolactobacillus sp.]MCI1881572.1 O-antigen ligase family protein [Sporolactobacillus sp.]
MIESKRTIPAIVVGFAALLAGFCGICSLPFGPLQIVFAVIWLWATIAFALFVRVRGTERKLMEGAMYVFVASTFLNQLFLNLSTPFFTLFPYRVMFLVCLAVFLVSAIKSGVPGRLWQALQAKSSVYFLLCWLGYAAVSLIWSWSVMDGIKSFFLLFLGIVFVLMAVFIFTDLGRLRVYANIWMVMTLLLLAFGLVNVVAHVQLLTSSLYGGPVYKLGFPTAVFINQNDFAAFLSVAFFFYLAYAKNNFHKPFGPTALLPAGLSLLLIFLTQSRASLLGIFAGLLVYGFLLLPNRFKKPVLWAGGVVLVAGLMLAMPKLIGKMNTFFNPPAGYSPNAVPTSNSVRVRLLQNTAHYLIDSYGFGVGPGNLSYYLEREPFYDTNGIFEVHNWIAEIFGNFGILIGTGYLLMYSGLFVSLYRLYRLRAGRLGRQLIETCMTAQAAFLVSSISPSSVSNLYFHWVFLGFVICSVSVLKNRAAGYRFEANEGGASWTSCEAWPKEQKSLSG